MDQQLHYKSPSCIIKVPWGMFHVRLRRVCILLLLDGIFCICLLSSSGSTCFFVDFFTYDLSIDENGALKLLLLGYYMMKVGYYNIIILLMSTSFRPVN